MDNCMKLMTSDNYKVLRLLYSKLVAYPDHKTLAPYTLEEIAKLARFGKTKTVDIMKDLESFGLVIKESKGKYALTHKAVYIIENIRDMEQNLPKQSTAQYHRKTLDIDTYGFTMGFMLTA